MSGKPLHEPLFVDVKPEEAPGSTDPSPSESKSLLPGASAVPVAHSPYPGSGTPADPYRVHWLSGDPDYPRNFSRRAKRGYTLTAAFSALVVTWTSSCYTGAMPALEQEFGVSVLRATLGISVFVLGFAVGPLWWAPLSEVFGRRIVFWASYAPFAVLNAATCGAQSMMGVLVLRFLDGVFGSSALSNSGGLIADVFTASERGTGMALYASAPFMGPMLGPLACGYIGQGAGWRGLFGFMAFLAVTMLFIQGIYVPETYSPVLLQRKAQQLTRLTGRVHVCTAAVGDAGQTRAEKRLRQHLRRPFTMLCKEPIVTLTSFYLAVIFGILYIMFNAYQYVFITVRGWNTGEMGVAFSGMTVGIITGQLVNIYYFVPKYARAFVHKYHGAPPPEARLPACKVGALCLPAGLILFAWTSPPSVYWMAPVAFMSIFGFGLVLVFQSLQNYLVDMYTMYAASALASADLMRAMFGMAFPLLATKMYPDLGLPFASSLLAALAAICAPIPFILHKHGAKIRGVRTRFAQPSETM